ncbi:MAG: peptidylprolyl isomerase [Acidobacteria bacterium]|nr:peptidylprolyl isomerase [Acidobacteriota bacterium]
MSKGRLWGTAISSLMLLAIASPVFGQGKTAKSQPNPVVAIETTMGTIKVELFSGKSPVTTRNFLAYVDIGFYAGTIVHRVDFVVGFGGYTESLQGRPTMSGIKNESRNGLKNLRGTVAMARYNDPDSATSQFYINLKNNSHLDASGGDFGYAVFGKVIEGMDVVDKIGKVKTGTRGMFSNIPMQNIIVKSVKALSK